MALSAEKTLCKEFSSPLFYPFWKLNLGINIPCKYSLICTNVYVVNREKILLFKIYFVNMKIDSRNENKQHFLDRREFTRF